MNNNWWTMKRMIEEREREIRAGVAAARPWLRGPASGTPAAARSREKGGLKQVMGRALLSWGSALLAGGR